MTKYEVYHSDSRGNSLFATSRTRKESAIKIAGKINLGIGELVKVVKDLGDAPGDCITIYSRRNETSEAAATLGRKGGAVKSDKKSAAARENGKKGGRPRTKPHTEE